MKLKIYDLLICLTIICVLLLIGFAIKRIHPQPAPVPEIVKARDNTQTNYYMVQAINCWTNEDICRPPDFVLKFTNYPVGPSEYITVIITNLMPAFAP